MKLKRIVALILTVMSIATVFSGCGGDGDDSDIITVTIWGSGANVKVDEEIARTFNETIGKEKGIKIDYQIKEGDTAQQIKIALQSGEGPDIFEYSNLKEAVENKYVAPLSAFEGSQEIIDKAISRNSIMQENTNMIDGEVYSISYTSMTKGLIYNKDMFKAAGLVDEAGEATPPETWDEFREYAKKLTNESKRQYGVIFPMKWSAWYAYDVDQCAMGSYDNHNFDVENMKYDYSDMNVILNTLMGIKEDGSCYPGSEGIDNDPARARFAEGNIGMKISQSWDPGVFKEQFPANFDWGVAPIPTNSKDVKYKQYMELFNAGYINYSVLETERKDAVWEVWKYWYGDDRARTLYEEGISLPLDYSLVADITTDVKGWKEFAELVEISATTPKKLGTVTTGKKSLKQLFIEDVWNGSMTVEEATAAYTKTANNGIDDYYKTNTNEDKAERIELIKETVNELRVK